MLSVGQPVSRLTKFFLSVAFPLFATSGFATPAADILDETNPGVRAAMAAQEEITPALMERPEILGTAIAVDEAGDLTLKVFVDLNSAAADEVARGLPQEVRGMSVQPEWMEEIRAMGHTQRQTPPIRLGTSGSWTYDFANGYCCGGTLGALVRIGNMHYVLSACHVLEGDTVLGGNHRVAQTGDPVIQPGLIDEQCNGYLAQTVGTLVKRSSLTHSNTDCAIARVIGGMVRPDGAILGIGTISHSIIAASLNQRVKKSGRTSALTRSHISGLNATVRVTITRECHGTSYTKVFTGQIVVANPSNAFLKPGDSGSLLVEDVAANPRPIGLLYAGNSNVAFANPIHQVLNFLGATMVGN
jgi:hypothetical protein